MNQLLVKAWIATTNRFQEFREMEDERGLTTTEIAVLTFVLVTAAVGIGALLYRYADGRVQALPEVTREDVITDGTD